MKHFRASTPLGWSTAAAASASNRSSSRRMSAKVSASFPGEILVERADTHPCALGDGVSVEAFQPVPLQHLCRRLQQNGDGLLRPRMGRGPSWL